MFFSLSACTKQTQVTGEYILEGFKNNWIQTVPGKGWNVLFRLYGPLEPWFDKSWKLPDPQIIR